MNAKATKRHTKNKTGSKKHSIILVSDNEVLQKTGWNKR